MIKKAELMTNAEFRKQPDIRIRLYVRKHLLNKLTAHGLGSHQYVDEAVDNLVIRPVDVDLLGSLSGDDQEELLDQMVDSLTNQIRLHLANGLSINWRTLKL